MTQGENTEVKQGSNLEFNEMLNIFAEVKYSHETSAAIKFHVTTKLLLYCANRRSVSLPL